MKRFLVLALSASLVVGVLGVAEAKKKKKPRKPVAVSVDQKFFFRQDADACGSAHNFLSLADGADLACFLIFGGAVYTANEAISEGSGGTVPVAVSGSESWVTEDGIPLVLDTAKHLTGELVVRGGQIAGPTLSLGQAMFGMKVTGLVGGETKEIGVYEEEWMTTPDDKHLVKVDITLDPALAGLTFESITVDTFMRGASIGPHTIELEAPAAFLTIPTIKVS